MLWRRVWQAIVRLRFVWLQAMFLAATAWVLWPLRGASTLPNPPWPSYTPDPPDLQESVALSPAALVPGAQGATRVIVYDPRTGQPLPDALVRVSLAPRGQPDNVRHLLYEGRTGSQGTVAAAFRVPPLQEVAWDLVIDVAGRSGQQRIVRPVEVRRETRIELATDHLVYFPGETIHLWLRALGGVPALPLSGRPVTFAVYDARDNLICQERVVTSAYGVALSGCLLADGAGLGVYRVTAAAGDARSPGHLAQRRVEVQAPLTPYYSIAIQADEGYALAGRPVAGIVRATYPVGQPLAGASVTLTAALRDQPAAVQARGETDATGTWRFALDVGNDLASAADRHGIPLRLSALVTDAEGRTQEAEAWLPAAVQPLLIHVEAENGALRRGLDNLIHARVTYPDGRPAACALTVTAPGLDRPEPVETGADGRAQWSYRPPGKVAGVSMSVTARDARGYSAQQQVDLPVSPGDHALLIRPERPSYRPGETAHLDLWLAAPEGAQLPGAVYLDVVHKGQMVAAHAAPVNEGRAVLDLPVAGEWSGLLDLHAYSFLEDGAPVMGARRIAIEPSGVLTVAVQSDRAELSPGDRARVSIAVAGASGPSALAVTAGPATAQRPEWDAVQPAAEGAASTAPESAPTVARAGTIGRARPTPERVIRAFESVASIRAARRAAFTALAGRLALALVAVAGVLCVAALGSAVVRDSREREAQPGFGGLVRRALGGLILLPLLGAGAALLAHGLDLLFGPGAVLVLGLSWFGALLALLATAWQRRDGWAHILWASAIAVLALGAGLRYARLQGAEWSPAHVWAGLAALACAALATFVWAATLARRGERGGAAAAWALLFVLLVTFAGGLAGSSPPEEGRPALDVAVSESPADFPGQVSLDVEAVGAGFSDPAPSTPSPLPAAQVAWTRPQGDWIYQAGALTDEQGRFAVEVPIPELVAGQPDWLVSVAAWGGKGEWGAGQAQLSVSRPLWIETSLPAVLTLGDELDLPIEVYNSAPLSQTVWITVTQASWFNTRVREGRVGQIEVAGQDVGVFYVPIRVREWGRRRLEVVAQGEQGRDELVQEVDVMPGGLRIWRVYDGQLQAARPAEPVPSSAAPPGQVVPSPDQPDEPPPETRYRFRVPWSAVQGSERVTVTLYPTWESVLAESLQAMHVRRLSGTTGSSSPTGPSRTTGSAAPVNPGEGDSLDALAVAIHAHALLYAALEKGDELSLLDPDAQDGIRAALESSYQRLLTFEAAGGGFGASPLARPDLYHTAEALTSLSELARYLPVDKALVERTARWLYQGQAEEGTWLPASLPPSWEGLPRPELPATAYATWSLIEAGDGNAPELRPALEHLARYPDKAGDPYVLALLIQALVAHDQAQPESPLGEALATALDLLAEMAEADTTRPLDGERAAWHGEIETWSGATGDGADVERTALAVYALLRAQRHPQLAAQGLDWLAERRDGDGLWGSDRANWLALRALLAAVEWGESPYLSCTVSVTVDGVEAAPLVVRSAGGRSASALGAVHSLAFDTLSKGYNDIVLAAEGIGPVPYRVVGTYVLPWDQVELPLPEEEEMSVEIGYDRTELAVGETITATVNVMLNRPGVVPLAVLELGLPPGFEIVEQEWQALVASGTIARYRRDGEQVIVHLADLSAEEPVRLVYQLRAAFPLWVWTLPTRAYDAANPERATVREPVRIEVK